MSDPYDMPSCSTCGDVSMYCKCIEKINDRIFQEYHDGKVCPNCRDRDSIVKIEYGYPGNEMVDKHDKGQIKLGGCMIHEDNPDYHCNKCDHEWQKSSYAI